MVATVGNPVIVGLTEVERPSPDHTTSGDFAEAERRFADAAATHERIPAPIWLARTQLEWARMLLTRRRPGDTVRARDLLGQALATARDLRLANIERRVTQLLAAGSG